MIGNDSFPEKQQQETWQQIPHNYRLSTYIVQNHGLALQEDTYFDKLIVAGTLNKNGYKLHYNHLVVNNNDDEKGEIVDRPLVTYTLGYGPSRLIPLQDLPGEVQRILQRQHNVVQGSEKWINLRKNRLTASDVARALNMTSYGNSQELFLEKTYQKQGFSGNEFTRHGQEYEPVAAAEYSKRTGRKLVSCGLVNHPKNDFLAASPDRIAFESPSQPCINLEIKCPYSNRSIDSIPSHYIPQIQVQMECLDLDVTHFVQFRPAKGNKPMDYTCIEVKRDRNWYQKHAPELEAFWKRVLEHRRNNPDQEEKLKSDLENQRRSKEKEKEKILNLDLNVCNPAANCFDPFVF